MKFTNFQRKSVSLIVLATFVALLHFWATPAPAATIAGNSETAIAQRDSGGPSFIEEESTEPVIKKAKKFPWLFIGLGVVVIGVAVYFLVIKKPKYTLTVTLGTGCTGTPAATAKFKKGESVPYNYSPQAGYGNLQVKLDGVAVAASGTVAMDKAHTLEVSASKEFTLTVHLGTGTTGTPSATAKYKEGQIVNYSYAAQAGYSNPQVKLDGAAVGTSGNIIMDKDKALTVTAEPLYTLTVTLGTCCTGSPAANGTYN